ncbi:HEAT repeat domain-containing protein [Archangium violaceum]|uniref:HEAT repeat domain-containing protein n=1 Tax=Archangium violaceum TaxID=83451 RepID=UPI00193B7F1B|nr:HEAT repeat domain-containing protein [Archangium violaceum]QRK12651.1 HEAT repeat domain-containing protein [Archangium violaceum]
MIRNLLEHPSASEFLRGFQEEHLSELAFLLARRQQYLHDPEVEWPEVEPLEVRILAHVGAMREGGDMALSCAREMLSSEAPDELAAAAHALVFAAPGGEGIAEVLARMAEADAVLLPCLGEALMLAHHSQLSERLGTLLDSKRPEVRVVAARVLGHRCDGAAEPLLPLLEDAVPEVRAAAAMAVAEMGYRPALPLLERGLLHTAADEWSAWVLAALRLGSPRALQACRQACRTLGPVPPRLPWLLGLAGDAQDFAPLSRLHGWLELTAVVLEALGLLGIPAAIPLLLEHLGHGAPEVKAAAASALALMTGAELMEEAQVLDEDSSDDDSSEVSGRKVVRPSVDAAVWRAWLREHRSHLEGKTRIRLGQPHGLGLCIEELMHSRASFDTRARASLELCIHSGRQVPFQPGWLVSRQRQAMAQWRQWWEATQRS